MNKVQGSFRDSCGHVYSTETAIYRTINAVYQEHWELLLSSGLWAQWVGQQKVVDFKEIPPLHGAWKSVEVEKIACITYPYEWSFLQLKDAALLTLEMQKDALAVGMTLKDASAYNVQFRGAKPVFIDLLSFEKREPNAPWQAYRQFCMHFLAPLALCSQDPRFGRMSALWIDGIPLDIAWQMLSWGKNLSLGLQMHLHLHSNAERKYSDGRKASEKVAKAQVSTQGLLDLTDSLIRTVNSLKCPVEPGEWTDYYTDTNYSSEAEADKGQFVREAAQKAKGTLALDLGANTGKFSAVLAPFFAQVIAADIDPQAVGQHYANLCKQGNTTVVPLVQDLANPSPGIGWACSERGSWMQRWSADCVCALALTHHLFFTNGIPWAEQALFFAGQLKPGGTLVLEFIPKEYSQVQRLLAARGDAFPEYSLAECRAAFSAFFEEITNRQLAGSTRTMLLLRKR